MTERHQIAYALLAIIVVVGCYALYRWRRSVAEHRARMRGRKHHPQRID